MSLKHPAKQDIELVLEDGRFARIRRPTRGDLMVSMVASKGEAGMLLAILVTRTTTIDDLPVTLEDWLEGDLELTAPIANALNRIFESVNSSQNRNGVA